MLSRWVHGLLTVRADRWVLVVLLLLLVYFAYHTLRGPHGLFAAVELNREIATTRAELDGLIARRIALERQVERLRPETLDLDLLDERVRATLGLIHEDEVIVLREGEEAAAAETD
ncbi:MAG TPA: septum formation initiator family protein [Geminicoccaceae bacterium]|nr:septum formation initiator family protein [Geminicoccaceae bacterium]